MQPKRTYVKYSKSLKYLIGVMQRLNLTVDESDDRWMLGVRGSTFDGVRHRIEFEAIRCESSLTVLGNKSEGARQFMLYRKLSWRELGRPITIPSL